MRAPSRRLRSRQPVRGSTSSRSTRRPARPSSPRRTSSTSRTSRSSRPGAAPTRDSADGGRRPERHDPVGLGSPIAHSLSPALHRAAYVALGLVHWTYEAREVDAAGFGPALQGLDASWRGLSLTMPLKEVALSHAASASDDGTGDRRRQHARSPPRRVACPQHRRPRHRRGTARRRLRGHDGRPRHRLGSTARSAVAASSPRCGTRTVDLMVRDRPRPETVAQAQSSGLSVEDAPMGEWAPHDVIVSTVPRRPPSPARVLPAPGRTTVRPPRRRLRRGPGPPPSVRRRRAAGRSRAGSTCSSTRPPSRSRS